MVSLLVMWLSQRAVHFVMTRRGALETVSSSSLSRDNDLRFLPFMLRRVSQRFGSSVRALSAWMENANESSKMDSRKLDKADSTGMGVGIAMVSGLISSDIQSNACVVVSTDAAVQLQIMRSLVCVLLCVVPSRLERDAGKN